MRELTIADQIFQLKTILPFVSQLSEDDWKLITPMLKVMRLKKGAFFVREGQICHQIGFLHQGILRVYYTTQDKEVTSYFNFHARNPIVSAFDSFLGQHPSNESIHALEDSILIIMTYDQLQSLYEQSPTIQKVGRLMAEQNYLLAVERIRSLQFQSASDRYEQLLKVYPQLINKIPHHYIASYLGVTPESLSRIRKSRE